MKAGQGLVSYRLGVRVEFSDMVIERGKFQARKTANAKAWKTLEDLGGRSRLSDGGGEWPAQWGEMRVGVNTRPQRSEPQLCGDLSSSLGCR